jgi:hypothetical protein
MASHVHHAQCACAAPRREGSGALAALLSTLGCAFCPACLAAWKPLLSVVGVTVALSDAAHHALLVGSLGLALAVAGWDLWRRATWLAFWLTVVGAAFLGASHALGLAALECAGLVVMLLAVPARGLRRARRQVA